MITPRSAKPSTHLPSCCKFSGVAQTCNAARGRLYLPRASAATYFHYNNITLMLYTTPHLQQRCTWKIQSSKYNVASWLSPKLATTAQRCGRKHLQKLWYSMKHLQKLWNFCRNFSVKAAYYYGIEMEFSIRMNPRNLSN